MLIKYIYFGQILKNLLIRINQIRQSLKDFQDFLD